MTISMAGVFPILANALPDFGASQEDWEECAPYFFLSDIRHFVCQKASQGASAELENFSILMEKLISEGDKDIQDMVMDTLEGLLECDAKDIVAGRFRPKTMHLWDFVSKQND